MVWALPAIRPRVPKGSQCSEGECILHILHTWLLIQGLQGVAKVGAVNADEHKDLGGKYGIRGFPTIKIFGANKNKPEDYSGARSTQGLVDAALAAIKSKVNANMGGKSGGSGNKVSKMIAFVSLAVSIFLCLLRKQMAKMLWN